MKSFVFLGSDLSTIQVTSDQNAKFTRFAKNDLIKQIHACCQIRLTNLIFNAKYVWNIDIVYEHLILMINNTSYNDLMKNNEIRITQFERKYLHNFNGIQTEWNTSDLSENTYITFP